MGAAKLLSGIIQAHPPQDVLAVVNTADDTKLHGLHISPDIDTVIYTLAGAVNPDTGWGLSGETWNAMDALERYKGITWFRLGDRDLATHMFRTHRLYQGSNLATVTAEIASAWGLKLTVMPVTNDPIQTKITTPDEGEIDFQDYFVRLRHNVTATAIRIDGAKQANPCPGLIDTLSSAQTIVIAPSNPIVSIAPILAVPHIQPTLKSQRHKVVAVSPIVGGKAIKGPTDRLMRELGHECSVVGIARIYADVACALVIDEADAHLALQVHNAGLTPIVAPTIMHDVPTATALAKTVLNAVPPASTSSYPSNP